MKNLLAFLVLAVFIGFANTSYGQFWKKKTDKSQKSFQKENTTVAKPGQVTGTQIESTQPKPATNTTVQPSESKSRDNQPSVTSREPITIDQVMSVSKPVVQEKPNGKINWTEQYVEAKGISIIDNERFKNPAQAKAMATRGAVVVAQRNLLEIVQGVSVTSETTVQDMMTRSDFIYTRIDGVIKGAQQVGEAIEKDGAIEVTMRVPLYETNGLAPIIYGEAVNDNMKFNEKKSPVSFTQNENTGLPEGLVFNYNGKSFDPSMFPVVLDEKGNLLLDLTKLYDPKEGKFPKVLQSTKEIFNELNFTKGTEVLNVVQAYNGKIVVDKDSAGKINWDKIQRVATTASKICKFVLTLL